MNSVGLPAVRGTASSTSPPMRCSTPSAFCVAKYRSATSPTKKGAAIAAIGFTLNGQELSVAMPWLLIYTAIVVYHAPQMKNSRNIMAPRRVPRDRMTEGLRCRLTCRLTAYLQAAGSCLMKYGRKLDDLG